MTSNIQQPSAMESGDVIRFDAPPWVHFALVVVTLLTALAAGYIFLGSLISGLVVGAGFVSLGAWRVTTYRRPAAASIFPVYIFAIAALLVHQLDQWYGGYASLLNQLFPSIFAAPVIFTEEIYVIVFSLGGTALFLYGGLGVLLRHPLGNYMAWFLFCWCVVESVSLFIVPVAADGRMHLIPGMLTAIVPIAAGVYGMGRLIAEYRNGR